MGKGIAKLALLLSTFISIPLTAAAGDIAVTVRVRTAGASPVAQAYVAIVPAWQPSSRPLAEEIAEKGVSVLHVPAGKYWLIAGVRGFGITSRGPVSVSKTSGVNLVIELPPRKPMTGTVSDEEGRSVAGARVAGLNGAVPPPLGTLSELAVRHLASDLSATTDQNGKWTRKLPDGAVPLLFEAAGRAAEWKIRPENGPSSLDVSLRKGATLKVTTDRVDPNLIVTLSREDPEAAASSLADEQPRVWARWTRNTVLTWSSLPPGVYGVYAKYPDPHYFMQTALKITTVTLAPGDQRAIRISLPSARRPAASSGALFLQSVSRKELGDAVETFGRDTAGNPKPVEQFVEQVMGGSVVYIKTDGVRGPFYGFTKDRFFSTVPDLAETHQEANVEPWPASVHPRAGAHFHLRFAEKDLQPPGSGVAVLRDCGDGDRVTVPIEVGKDNLARFTAAAGCQSMVLEFEPFEPVVTGRVLQAGEQSLGEFLLRAAGLADVHVVRAPSEALVAGATVRAVSEPMPGERPIVVKEAVTDDRGWAHLSGLPTRSRLRVVAETADGDRSDAVPFQVAPLERGVIDPLAVTEPATVIAEVRIDKAFLERFPSSRVVQLTMRPNDRSRESERRQDDDPASDTPVRFDRLHAGSWQLSGSVVVAGSYSLMKIGDLDLKAGETRRVEKTITPNVFEGIVTRDGKGLRARVTIDDGSNRINFDSDASGIFRVVLQERGTYRVAVAPLSSQGNIIPIGDIRFDDPSRRIEIAIPKGGSVTTRVRSGDQPLPGSVVWLSRREDSGLVEELSQRGRTTDLNGDATFDDLVPGSWTFSVRQTESRRGAQRTVTVDEGADTAIVLDLADATRIEGTIRDLGGSPLSHAHVECLFVGPTGNPDRASADSNAEGAFSVDLIPPVPSVALCSVLAPTGAVDAFKAFPGQALDVVAPAATAALTISDWNDKKPFLYWLVAPDGRAISLNAVALGTGAFRSAMTIFALAAGRWKIVRVDTLPQLLSMAAGMANSLPPITEFTLRAGTAETVHLGNPSQ
jgi:hypothetical protein